MVIELLGFDFPHVGRMVVVETPGRPPGAVFTFPNGYGASVISHGYGASRGQYELMPLDAKGEPFFMSDITDAGGVVGYLTPAQVRALLVEISERAPRQA